MGGLLGIIILILDVVAIVDCWKTLPDQGKKVLWTVLIVLFPLVGLIVYYLIGKKK